MDIEDLQEFQSITYMHEKSRIEAKPVTRTVDRIGNLFDKLRDARDLMPEGKITPFETARLLSESIGSLKALHEHLFEKYVRGDHRQNQELIEHTKLLLIGAQEAEKQLEHTIPQLKSGIVLIEETLSKMEESRA